MIVEDTKYKSSDVVWMQNVPNDWDLIRLRFLCEITTGNKNTEDKEDEGIYPFFVRSQTIERINSYSFEGEGILTAGDGVGVGKVFHYVNEKIAFHQRVYLLYSFSSKIKAEYLFFYLQTFLINELMIYNAKSTVDSIRLPILKDFLVNVPPIDEQDEIVLYIKSQSEKINHFIEKKQRFIELLKEQRQSIINQAVTKGIVDNVKMKPSGIEWLGDVPEHWEVRRLKNCIEEKLKYGANESGEEYNPSWYRYIRITDFNMDGKLDDENKLSLPLEIGEEYELKEGDILFARSGTTVGKTFQFHYVSEDEKYCYAGYLIKASPDKKVILSDFLYDYTCSKAFENWKNSIFNKATIENIGADKYCVLKVPVPPINEQQQIIQYIKTETQTIDKAIGKAEREIELIKEYKEAMIAEAVTGQLAMNSEQLKDNKSI